MSVKPLPASELRWRCSTEGLDFESTAEVEPTHGVIAQPLAVEALRFGLDCKAPDQNVFVRGVRGTGRMTMIRDLLEEIGTACGKRLDRCYVHNFLQPDRPRLVSLPKGEGRVLRRRLRNLAEFVERDLGDAMNSKPLQASRTAMQEEAQEKIEAITKPLEEELAEHGLALVQVKAGQGTQAAIFATWQGQPVPPEQMDKLLDEGKVTPEERDAYREKREQYARRLPELTTEIGRVQREMTRKVEAFNERHLRRLIADMVEPIKQDFNNESITVFLDEVMDDIVENALHGRDKDYDPHTRYGVNILLEHLTDKSPVVHESSPTLSNLLGTIETQWSASGRSMSDYRGIRGGALLRADGGFLILDAHDVLAEPGAWKILMRTLRTGKLEIVPSELNSPFAPVSLKPEPIPVNIRVVLLGSTTLYHLLDRRDYDFSELFKVLADFSDTMDRDRDAIWHYAGILSRIIRGEDLKHFTAGAVAAMVEHGARIAGKGTKVTARFGRISDIAREASWLADREDAEYVTAEHVRETVTRTKRRASLPSIRFHSYLKDGTIRVDTEGTEVGQVNGLAVITAGPLTYGFPARITATIAAGDDGIIDIEGRSAMSGSIHTKGFHILGGLVRHLLKPDHPLMFSASLAFEQSYGGIDGDSASGAEVCCLLSALTGIPLRQDLAITGAIDQHGGIQAIGGVNEKIEGFYDICDHFGLTGSQGVIVPEANAADLMLRPDVVTACDAGRFHVYAVDSIYEALALLSDSKVGRWNAEKERYEPGGSLLAIARDRAREFWIETRRTPKSQGKRKASD